ncbi:MAG: NAD-dependent succinate-semialdehyde dehydrogenase [Parvibaculaceae bacterium]
MAAASYPDLYLLIGGERLKGNGRKTQAVRNPADTSVLGELPHATREDLDKALDWAAKTWPAWKATPAIERARIIERAADIIRERAKEIATIMTLEQGKVLAESMIEVHFTADTLEWYAEECKRAYGRVIPSRAPGQRLMVLKEPVGPVAAFSPWNFPALTPARKVGASLAAGCTCILKPAEETPGTALALARALEDAGLPKGVLSVVFGVPNDISTYLIASPVIRKISFTGSTAVGKHLAGLAAQGVKRATMELGGHAPVLIFDDADIGKAATLAAASKMRNAGQVCVSPTRFYVQEKAHDKFVEAFVSELKTYKQGPGIDETSKVGPMANPRRVEAMERLVADAKERGAKVALGGRRPRNDGWFFEPTVLTDVPEDALVMNEEPFGPIAPVARFSDFDDAIAKANRLPMGLAAYAFTSSHAQAAKLEDAVESGMIALNHFVISAPEAPFGGVKESGYGHEGGIEGLEAYLQTKYITAMP